MKKKNKILTILSIITSLLLITIYASIILKVNAPFINYLREKRAGDAYVLAAFFQLISITFTLIICISREKELLIVYLIISILTKNIFSIILASLLLSEIINEEKRNRKNQKT